ncbi:MAG: TonB-dependent receptor, partial [Pseudomonadota bacterium]
MPKAFPLIVAATLCCASAPVLAHPDDKAPSAGPIENVVVYGRAQERLGISHTASEGLVGYDDIRLPPLLRVGELVEAVPGMIATQHSGTGKANQYFLRGFNLDHGTDFSVHLDDMPLNMRSHGHGQGYLDLNVIIPELVQTTEFRKGPYHAEIGDFSSAGSAEFTYYDRLPAPVLQLTLGEFGYQRGLVAGSTDVGGGPLLIALDHTRYDGPWDLDEDARLTRLYASWSRPVGNARARISVHSYDSEWNSTDQIPGRAVRNGTIDLLGFIDPDLGGASSRHAITGKLEFDTVEVGAYATRMDFELFSNFTYFLEDPVNGDEFEQIDERNQYGAFVHGVVDRSLWERPLFFRYGATLHVDTDVDLGLYQTSARQRLATIREDTVDQSIFGTYAELELAPVERLRVIAGLRFDRLDWDIDAAQTANSGDGDDNVVSPNLNLAYRLSDRLEAYASWGRGFHSNDLRGAAIRIDPGSGDPATRVDPFARSEGAEIGLRYEAGERFNLTAVLFQLDLDSELV